MIQSTEFRKDGMPKARAGRPMYGSLIKNHFARYFVCTLICGTGIWGALQAGKQLESKQIWFPSTPTTQVQPVVQSGVPPITNALWNSAHEPVARLFIQLILIIGATRLVGSLFTKIRQPLVVGEMVAGLLLGPSLFGWLWPHAAHFVFEPQSLPFLSLLSQVGICLFMFVVGMNLEVEILRHRAKTAMFVSHISIVFPFMLGTFTALYLYQFTAHEHLSFLSFALFMGISMSITAFPVLARIVEERGLLKTPLGDTALTCAIIGDITAWVLLAFIIAVVKATGIGSAVLSLGLAIFFICFMLLGVKPAIAQWFASAGTNERGPKPGGMTWVLLFVLGSAFFTHLIGIHAMFGAFLAGVVFPSDGVFRNWIQIRIESFTSTFLLPIFFAFTGLSTNVRLLGDPTTLALCAAIILIATGGKLGGTFLMARWTGMDALASFRLGALMNTRGLMELIALNIGYELGILPVQIFSILVIMAITTTLMTGPLLTLADRFEGFRLRPPALSR